MNVRINLDDDTQRRAEAKAAELGLSIEEYVRRLVSDDVRESGRKVDMPVFFGLVTDGPPSDIARNKDEMIAEAVSRDHSSSLGMEGEGRASR